MQLVGRWKQFEITVPNRQTYSNPFTDISLDAVFTAPDGREVACCGFFDGRKWCVRFMPDLAGTWGYRTTFSDGTPGCTGRFECVPTDVPGLITADPGNPFWFGSAGGRPLLLRSLHVGDCFFADESNTVTGAEWSPAMRTAFLDWAQAQGYNMLSIASHYLNRRHAKRGEGWLTPDLWDAERQCPRPDQYDRMERTLDELAARGIVVYPFAGFMGRDSNYPTDPAVQELFIRYTLARLAAYWNVVFMVGGPEPAPPHGNPYLTHADITRLGGLIRDLDPYGHLCSIHNPTGDDLYRDEEWLTYVTLQGPKTIDRAELIAGLLRNHHPAKPLYAQETLWPGNVYHCKSIGHDYTRDDIRKNAFVMLFSGAAINFADNDGDSSTGFSGHPDLAARKQAIHDAIRGAWDMFATLPFYQFRPRPDLVDNGFCLASDDLQRVLVYLETPGEVRLDVEGHYRALWIDAGNPAHWVESNTVSLTNGLHTPEGIEDAVVDLVRVGDDVAGQIHLSWPDDPSTSFAVVWHTLSLEAGSDVHVREPGGVWRKVQGTQLDSPGSGVLHRTSITGLKPDTAYDYRVSGGPVYRTRTAPSGPCDFTFAFVCDTGLIGRPDGNATGTRQVMAEILRDRPLFILGGGDYAYGNKDGRFDRMSDAIDTWFVQWQDVLAQFPFMPQYGNHEIHLVERYEDWAPRFTLPEGCDGQRNYSFDVGDVHFTSIFLPGEGLSDEQLQWIDSDLAAARQGGARWLIAYQHESMYGHGTSHPAYAGNRKALAPIFERHALDLHLSGHDQNYERTYPLTNVAEEPKVVSRELDSYQQSQGVIYAKISPGGKMSEIGNQFSQLTTPQQEFMAVRDCAAHHYALVHVRRDGTIETEVFSVKGDGTPRELLDRFTINAQ